MLSSFRRRRNRHFERHHDPAALPDSIKSRNRSYDQPWTLVPRLTNAGAPLLPTWDNGSEADKRRKILPLNDPHHLPPPSQFVSLASPTAHSRLAIPSIGKINNRFIRLASAFPPQSAAWPTSHPLSASAYLNEPHATVFIPTLSIATGQFCRAPHFNETSFHGAPLSRPPPLPPRLTCRIPHALLRPGVLPQSRLPPVSADHLEEATALLLTVWLVLISTNVGFPTAPFSRLPWHEPPGHQRYLRASFSVHPPARPGFPNYNKPNVYRSRLSLLATPPSTGSLPLLTALQLSSTTQPRATPIDSVSVASEHRTVPPQPNGRESPSDTNTSDPLSPQQPCRCTT